MQRSSIELLEEVDDAIVYEKDALRTIKIKMIVYTVLMTILIASYWIFELEGNKLFDS